jgi:hypothetical protein
LRFNGSFSLAFLAELVEAVPVAFAGDTSFKTLPSPPSSGAFSLSWLIARPLSSKLQQQIQPQEFGNAPPRTMKEHAISFSWPQLERLAMPQRAP